MYVAGLGQGDEGVNEPVVVDAVNCAPELALLVLDVEPEAVVLRLPPHLHA